MENEQKKLHQRLNQIKSKQPSGGVSEHSSYFAEKENSADSRRRGQIELPIPFD